jgi:hypothetical protein
MNVEGASRGFEECACAHSSQRAPDLMQRIGLGLPTLRVCFRVPHFRFARSES